MKLPNGENAIVDIRKLTEYCLNTQHLRGRNKARVFAAHGITSAHAHELRSALLRAAANSEANPGTETQFGRRYVIDFEFSGQNRIIRIRSAWIIKTDQESPYLTTCYVL